MVTYLELPLELIVGRVVRNAVNVDIVTGEVGVLVAEGASLRVAASCGTLNGQILDH